MGAQMPSESSVPSVSSPNRWPMAIVGALVGVAVVQAAFVFIASHNPPVLVSETAYADAQQYDAVIEARRAAAALGWRVEVAPSVDGVIYRVADAAGAPVRGLGGTLRYARADTTAADAERPFVEVEPGAYRAQRPAMSGVFRLSARLDGGRAPWVDSRAVVLP